MAASSDLYTCVPVVRSVCAVRAVVVDAAHARLRDCGTTQTELNLLRKLHHQNIVEYKETIQSDNALYIVLEFVENGSLLQMIKRYGCFPEPLTAVYVYQVLNGLAFLHKQGVIHRDIKVRRPCRSRRSVIDAMLCCAVLRSAALPRGRLRSVTGCVCVRVCVCACVCVCVRVCVCVCV